MPNVSSDRPWPMRVMADAVDELKRVGRGEQALWCAVIYETMRDLIDPHNPSADFYHRTATDFFMSARSRRARNFVCELAGLDVSWLLDRALPELIKWRAGK